MTQKAFECPHGKWKVDGSASVKRAKKSGMCKQCADASSWQSDDNASSIDAPSPAPKEKKRPWEKKKAATARKEKDEENSNDAGVAEMDIGATIMADLLGEKEIIVAQRKATLPFEVSTCKTEHRRSQ